MGENMERQHEEQKKLFTQLDIELDALSIHNQLFTKKFRGYHPDEVDTFLDTVIKDYEQFFFIINDLLNQYEKMQRQANVYYEALQRKQPANREADSVVAQAVDTSKSGMEGLVNQLQATLDELKCRLEGDWSTRPAAQAIDSQSCPV